MATPSKARWQKIGQILDEVFRLPPEERLAYLDEACAGDPALREEVASYLALDEEDGAFLIASVLEHTPQLIEGLRAELQSLHEADALEGLHIGAYKLLREIGHGGMGVVYLAERVDGQFEHQVALKLIKRGMDTDEIQRRFLNERQILARLEHPNIARLYDGGVTESGLSYFVMEYIEGIPITDYCDQRRLAIDARLGIFQQVCEAVQYAHQNLVVHRDLKPGNILVTGAGTVKLLDFGIAKLLGEEDDMFLTRTGMRALTPDFAAPEQLRDGVVTTATDVYALGVILYELLSGHRPYRIAQRVQDEAVRIVCEVQPERPSAAVTNVEAVKRRDGTTETITPEYVSSSRSSQVRNLQRRLRGDLDNVVLMAMRKEPSRRYASAEALLEDLTRYRRGRAVAACKDTVGYRTQKFVQRHRFGVGVAAVMVALLVGFAVIYTLGITQERNLAQTEAEKARQIAAFMIDLFEVSSPDKALGDTITARQLLDQGAQQIRDELEDQPAVQATMMDAMGQIYLKLGLYDKADSLLEAGLNTRRRLFGDEHPDVAASLNNLGMLHYQQGTYDEAKAMLSQATAIRRRVFGDEHPDLAESLNNLGVVLYAVADYEGAESCFREVVTVRRRLLGDVHADVALAMNNLAALLRIKGDYEAAEPLYRQALDIRRQLLGEVHPDVAQSLNNLAVFLYSQGDYEGAERFFRQALDIDRQVFGNEHPTTVGDMNNLAAALEEQGDYHAAEPLRHEVLDLYRKSLGPEHPFVATALNNLASLLDEQGQYEDAEPFHRAALAMRRKLLGDEHPAVSQSLNNLAGSLRNRGDYAAAEPLYREALAMRRARYGDEHARVAGALNGLAGLLRMKGAYDDADSSYREALAIYRTIYPKAHPSTANTLIGLGRLLLIQGLAAEAQALVQEALEIQQQTFDQDHWRNAEAQSILGACLTALEQYEDAEPLLLDSFAALKETRGASHAVTLQASDRLRALYEAWGKPDLGFTR